MQAFLETRDLVKSYGDLKAVDGVSFKINPGECFALLGPNGAGKTTTLEMLEGLVEPDAGTVTFFGKSLSQERDTILQDLGILMQETYLYKKLTVHETLSLFASFFKHAAKPETVIARLKLDEKADSRLEHLSGGQKQRAYLGCALINNPKLVFLDEPTTGLDPQARRMIWDLLEELKREGKSILLTTHYMDEAEKLADLVAVMDHGKIIATGSPKELINRYCGDQILSFSFVEDKPERYRALQSRLPWLADSRAHDGLYEVNTLSSVSQLQDIFKECLDLNLELNHLEMRRSTLEDVFLRLTGRSMRDA